MQGLIYLASPYSDVDEVVRKTRYFQTMIACKALHDRGVPVISPIVYGHQFAQEFGAPIDYDYWETLNQALTDKADQLVVLQLFGWNASVGIAKELLNFSAQDKYIGYITMREIYSLKYEGAKVQFRTEPDYD